MTNVRILPVERTVAHCKPLSGESIRTSANSHIRKVSAISSAPFFDIDGTHPQTPL